MKSEDVVAFVSVVKHGSLSRAAKALRLPQSVVTRRVQNFESVLGVTLLDRSSRPLKPSQLGLRVYEESRLLLRQLDTLTTLVSAGGTPTGTFRLGVPQFVSESVLINAVQTIKEKFPELIIEVTTELSDVLLDSVEEGELNAALVVVPQPIDRPGVSLKPLVTFEMDVIAPKGEFLRRPYHLKEISDRGWILNPGACGFRQGLERALTTKGLPLKVNLDVFGTEVQLGLVAKGMGLGLVPAQLFDQSPHFDEVHRIKIADFKSRHKLWLAQPMTQGSIGLAVNEFGKAVQSFFR